MKKRTTVELINEEGDIEKIYKGKRNPVCLVLDNIRSVYNVGAIFRTCDATKIEKLYLCGITAYPPRPDLEKTALRTVEFVPWEYHASTIDLIKQLKKENYHVTALEQTDQSANFNEFNYPKPLAIVLGNEVDGIGQEVRDLCDDSIEIPMYGIANSLNVATSIGIVLYKAIGK